MCRNWTTMGCRAWIARWVGVVGRDFGQANRRAHSANADHTQIRVMPRCAYVLLRFYLRVDKVGSLVAQHPACIPSVWSLLFFLQVLVRLRETRLCVEFTADARGRIVRECKTSEGTFQELQAGGAPPAEVWVVVVFKGTCPFRGVSVHQHHHHPYPHSLQHTWMQTVLRLRCRQ